MPFYASLPYASLYSVWNWVICYKLHTDMGGYNRYHTTHCTGHWADTGTSVPHNIYGYILLGANKQNLYSSLSEILQ